MGDALTQTGQRPRFEHGSGGGGGGGAAGLHALNGQQLAFGVAGGGQHIVQYRADHAELGARGAQLVRIGTAVGVGAARIQSLLFDGLDLGAERRAATLHGQPFGVVLEDGFEDGFGALAEAERIRFGGGGGRCIGVDDCVRVGKVWRIGYWTR